MERKHNKQPKLHVRTGDDVIILAGKDRGQKGKIIKVIPAKGRALVEGKNMVTKHVKPSTTSPEGGVIKKEASIHLSNLMLLDPKTGEPTRIGRKADKKGKMVRYSKKTGEIINNG